MVSYALALFLHIIGAIGIFLGLGMEGLVLKHLGYAETNLQALKWGDSMKLMRIVFAISSLLLLIPGIYMEEAVWGWTAWVIIGLVLLAVLSAAGSMNAKKAAVNVFSLSKNNDPIPEEIKSKLRDPMLLRSYKMRLPIAAGIIYIMTLKPGWTGSIVTIIISIIMGILINLPAAEKSKELESA